MWKNVIMWVLSVFMILSGIVFFPSIATFILFIAGLIIMPLNIFDDLFEKINFTGWKILLLFSVLFLVAVNFAPNRNIKETENVSPTGTVTMESSDELSAGSMDSAKDITGSLADVDKSQDLSGTALTRGSMGDDKEESDTASSISEPDISATPAPTATPVITGTGTKGFPEANDPADYDVEEKVTYVLNTNTMKFHKPSCTSVKEMSTKNRMDVTWDRNTVIRKGYSPCGRCKP